MPQSDQPSPESPGSKSPKNKQKKTGDGKGGDRQPSNNLFMYMLIGLVILAVVFSIAQNQRSGDELKFSEFWQGLTSDPPEFSAANVHELVIDVGRITFQDKPAELVAKDSDAAKTLKVHRIPITAMGDAERDRLTDLLNEKNINYEFREPTPEWQTILYLSLPMIIVLIFLLFIFRRMGGAGSAMSFGRSRGKMYAQEDIGVLFDHVAGIDEAVGELREIVEFLRTPAKYQALGGRIPRGVLLVGPPGTGKTLLAKAVAGEAGVPFFSLSGSDFVEMFVGVGAARVRDMFQQAAQRSPSIIFIDELDALGKVRGSGMPGGHDEREQTLNALLVEMDGFSSDQSVIVMAATNRPETLDPALLRPGRFDRHVTVDRPDIKGREAILKVHAVKIKMDDQVDLQKVARMTPGFVGADLANLVNEAALLAARNGKDQVMMEEFEDGVERVIAGLEKQTRIIHEDEKLRVAYHECGHALVACSLPHTDPVHKISIIPRGMGALGYTLQLPVDDRQLLTQTELYNRVCVLLGGTITEEIVFQEISTGAQNDLQRATDISRRMVTEFGMSPKLGRVHYSEHQRSPFLGTQTAMADAVHSEATMREIDIEVKRIIDEAVETVYELLSSRREVLERMSLELVECETMDAEHLKRILNEFKTSPQISPGTFAPPSLTDEDLSRKPEQESTESPDDDSRESADGGA